MAESKLHFCKSLYSVTSTKVTKKKKNNTGEDTCSTKNFNSFAIYRIKTLQLND